MTNDELLWTTNIWRELEDHLSELERATGKGTPEAGEYAVSALDIGMCPSIVLNQSYISTCMYSLLYSGSLPAVWAQCDCCLSILKSLPNLPTLVQNVYIG